MNDLIPASRPPTLVQRKDFRSCLDHCRQERPFLPEYIGMRDPYTGLPVLTAEDYDAYLREYAFHAACDAACRRALRRRIRNVVILVSVLALVLVFLLFARLIPEIRAGSYAAGYAAGVSGTADSVPPSSAAPGAATVYITDTGEKYHRSGCQYLAQSSRAISLSDAVAKGYTPCSRCGPPRLKN